MEIGIFSFGETRVDPDTGRQLEAGQRLRRLVDEAELADQVGLDVFGIGEHHRPDYAVSAPAVVLAAAAARTERIRLTPTVSVLSSDDPVRVFQDYATLDRISRGRAEIMVGRGSFTESFPLFGQDLADYEEIFAEKLDLLLKLREPGRDAEGDAPSAAGRSGTDRRPPEEPGRDVDERIRWKGHHRPSIQDRGVYPRPEQEPIPLWIAVGGTPRSVVRAGTLGLPMALAIIGGAPARFKPLVELYREAADRAGHDASALPVSINAHGFLADERETAARLALPPFLATMNRIGRERGWPPMGPGQLEAEAGLHGALVLGSPQEVIDKILYQHELFGQDRYLIQLTVGPLPRRDVMRAIELLGTEVAPVVRRETAASV
ncbi:MAG: LLM class flavin-dependent oxidoreductase [Gemmatimonadota bacterium]